MTNDPLFNMGKPVDPPPIDLLEPTLADVVKVTSGQANGQASRNSSDS